MKYISLSGLKRALEQIVNYVKAQIKSNVTDKLGTASGIATLGTDGKLTSGQLPSIDKTYVGLGNVTNTAQIPLSQKGAVNGVATLGADGKVPSSQLPSYVDDVLEYTNKSSFPTTGETGKIYVDTSTNKTYRWSGTTYVEISASLALGETSSTAYAGDKGKALATQVSTLENTVINIPGITLTSVDQTAASAADGAAVTIAFKKYDRASSAESSVSTKIPAATSSSAGVMSKADKTKLDNIAVGAEVNQNTFSKVVVGKTIIEADNKADSLTLVAGSNVTITPDVANDKITIAAKDTTYSAATTSANGLMSAADKTKLDGITAGAQVNVLESVKVNGKALTVTDKAVNIDLSPYAKSADTIHVADVTATATNMNLKMRKAAGETPICDVIFNAATTSAAGLMSSADKSKLDGIVAATDDEIDTIFAESIA